MVDRGQAMTLDALIGAFILASALLFALNITVVTPLTTSTSSQHIENQNQARIIGTLSYTEAQGFNKMMALYWDESNARFHNSGLDKEYDSLPSTQLGDELREFRDEGLAVNVDISYQDRDEDGNLIQRQLRVVDMGRPTANSVSGRESFTVFDSDVLYDESENPTGTTVKNSNTLYMEDVSPNSPVYNQATIEVVLWRI